MPETVKKFAVMVSPEVVGLAMRARCEIAEGAQMPIRWQAFFAQVNVVMRADAVDVPLPISTSTSLLPEVSSA